MRPWPRSAQHSWFSHLIAIVAPDCEVSQIIWIDCASNRPANSPTATTDRKSNSNPSAQGEFMSAAISLHKVVKHYRRNRTPVEVLHELDLEVRQGEFLALMGPSGSGKTTLLNLIGGLDSPSEGEVIVSGQHLEAMSGGELAKWRARHIGFVFQFYNLMPM